jgi:hypothetical protein
MSIPIPEAIKRGVRLRSGDRCEGLYKRVKGGAERIGPCPCRGRWRLVFAHIQHRGNGGSKSRDKVDNILHLCVWGHELFDERITKREFDRQLHGG